MQYIAPLGNVYQAGTLSGNPIAMIAGYTMLTDLKNDPSIYEELNKKALYLKQGLEKVLFKKSTPYRINQIGSMISLHFSDKDVVDFDSASKSNIEMFNKLFHHMLANGIYLPPSAYESWFLSNALSFEDIDKTCFVLESFEFN